MFKYLLFTITVFVFFSCGKKVETSQKSSVNTKISLPIFDSKNAFSMLTKQTDFGPRNPNSQGHKNCAAFLIAEMKKYADTVVTQNFTYNGYDEQLSLTNIFSSFNPSSSKRILLLAHWDTRPRAEMDKNPANRNKPIIGANDGASGVAVLLELARVLKNSSLKIGVDILFTDGEDYGKENDLERYFLGAKHFAKTKPSTYTPQYGILLDMVGDKDLQLPMEGNSLMYAPAIVDKVWSIAEQIGVTEFVKIPGNAIADDHLALNEVGIPTIDIIDFTYPYWHTAEDTPDKCSPESLEAVGKVLVHLIYNSQ